ncbi:MAG TPA: SCO family protein [Candidatus Baltobacteraceae bacterium]|jgi:protein SCO1/2|nr:SCO family protein [Candidatus Baltobacteraceae bacterium]
MHTTLAALILAAVTMLQPKLVDQTGHAFTFASLRGAPVALTFVSAHCSDACPLINAQYAAAASALDRERKGLRLLTITLDPERDSLRDMRRLAATFHANSRRWIVAGGSVADVHAVMNAFGVVATRGKDGYADFHTTAVYLIDARGVFRKVILPSNNLADQLAGEVRGGATAVTR